LLEFPGSLAHPVDVKNRSSLSVLGVPFASHGALIAIVAVCVGIEAVLQGADLGLWGSPRWRGLVYQYGGFWRGLLDNWQPNYAAQPAVMFASYSFLHGGLAHLLVNMITLVSLGRVVVERAGQARFAVIYALSLLGGAAGFAALSPAVQPMVGASGALFGLAGAITGWEYSARRGAREGMGPILRVVGLLVGLNAVMYWAMDGNLAWQAHLGGFLAGWAASRGVRPRS
jgi:membrane associated rhomboid family serine protease